MKPFVRESVGLRHQMQPVCLFCCYQTNMESFYETWNLKAVKLCTAWWFGIKEVQWKVFLECWRLTNVMPFNVWLHWCVWIADSDMYLIFFLILTCIDVGYQVKHTSTQYICTVIMTYFLTKWICVGHLNPINIGVLFGIYQTVQPTMLIWVHYQINWKKSSGWWVGLEILLWPNRVICD